MKGKSILSFALAFTLMLAIGGAGFVAWFLSNNSWGLTVESITKQSFPEIRHEQAEPLAEKWVEEPNYFEIQGTSQCAGFSSAYVLRQLGEDVTGLGCYEQMSPDFTLSSGYILPQGIIDLFEQYGYTMKMYRGDDITDIKSSVTAGHAPIVLTGNGGAWQHYLTVVGYDVENVYLYDSNFEEVEEGYTRVMSWSEFDDHWTNKIPFFERVYFEVE